MTPFRVAHKVPALFFLPRFFAAFSLASYLPRLARVWCLCVCSVFALARVRTQPTARKWGTGHFFFALLGAAQDVAELVLFHVQLVPADAPRRKGEIAQLQTTRP